MKRTLEKIIEDELPKVNLNKKQLAELVGLSTSHFNNISKGKASTRKSGYRPDPKVVNKLAHYLKVSVEEILEGQGYELTQTPAELVSLIEKYKTLPESEKTKVLIILETIFELILLNGQSHETEPRIGKTRINGQEVNVRVVEPVGNLENLLIEEKK